MFLTAGVFARMMYKRNAEEPGVVSEHELPEGVVPSASPEPISAPSSGSGGVAVIERREQRTAVAAQSAREKTAAPTVRAHPGNAFWIAMTGVAIVLAAGALLVAVAGLVA